MDPISRASPSVAAASMVAILSASAADTAAKALFYKPPVEKPAPPLAPPAEAPSPEPEPEPEPEAETETPR